MSGERRISLGEGYWLVSDQYCCWIAKEHTVKKGKTKGKKEQIRASGYKNNIEDALVSHVSHVTRTKQAKSIKSLIDEIKSLKVLVRTLNWNVNNGGWIPCSEKKAEFPCIISDANGNAPSIPTKIATVTDKKHGEWQIDASLTSMVMVDGKLADGCRWENRIVAWMPLPDPYKGGDDE